MWPYKNVNENVVSSSRNDAEEDTNLTSSSSSPPPSPFIGFADEREDDHRMSSDSSISETTQEIPVDEVLQADNSADSEINSQERRIASDEIDIASASDQSRSLLRNWRPAAWRRRIYLPPLRRSPLPFLRNTRRRRTRGDIWPIDEDTESDSDEEVLHPPGTITSTWTTCSSMNLLLLKSIESYAAVQRTTAVRQLRCECSEVLTVEPIEELPSVQTAPMAGFFPHSHRSRLHSRTFEHSPSASGAEDEVQSQNDEEDLDRSLSDDEDAPPRADSSFFRSDTTFNISINKKQLRPLEPTPYRWYIRLMQSMPQPNRLAKQVANRVIKFARCARNILEEAMCCIYCGLFPVGPVTGPCGHTRCTNCVKIMANCPCGTEPWLPVYVNILIRNLHQKNANCRTIGMKKEETLTNMKTRRFANKLLRSEPKSFVGPIRRRRGKQQYGIDPGTYHQKIPMTARARFIHAMELLQNGRHADAAPYVALAATCYHSDMRAARTILAQIIMILSKNRDPWSLVRDLNNFVAKLTSMSWIQTKDMECILCSDIYVKPVTTPCGHMFCRTCIEKTLDYRKRCPLCLRSLNEFKLAETSETVFMTAALASINAVNIPKPLEEDDLVPIFVCTVAYPSVPCPLFIFDPRYWLMIRRVLESGSRRFGMVAMDRDKKYADYGTVLEVRDCVHLEDGRSILSTIGLSRFKVIERCVRDGCEVARIQPIYDVPPDEGIIIDDLKMYASQITLKAILWLSQLGSHVVSDIENAFGSLPSTRGAEDREDWWDTTDGPAWLWWLVAVLPLRTEIKVLILSTDCLVKRMMAVARTLEAVARVALTTITPDQCQVQMNMPSEDALIN